MPMRSIVGRLLVAMLCVALVTFVGGSGIFLLGHGRWSIGESLYMAIISASTVGFGELPELDRVPGARAVTVGTILAGVAAFAYFQSVLTATIVEGVLGHAWRRKSMDRRIAELSDHFVVAGVGTTGRHIIEELVATGRPYVAIDRTTEGLERVNTEIADGKMLYVCGNATEDHTLIAAGVERAAGVIAALTDDQDNLYVTLSARTLNARARIVTKVIEPEAMHKMLRAGANATVSPNMIGGRRLVSEMVRPAVVEFLDQMMRDKEQPFRFEEVPVPENSAAAGRTLASLDIRRVSNALVVAVRDRDRKFTNNPGPDYVIQGGTVLLVLGDTREAVKLAKLLAED